MQCTMQRPHLYVGDDALLHDHEVSPLDCSVPRHDDRPLVLLHLPHHRGRELLHVLHRFACHEQLGRAGGGTWLVVCIT